jgi:hypothetical protein
MRFRPWRRDIVRPAIGASVTRVRLVLPARGVLRPILLNAVGNAILPAIAFPERRAGRDVPLTPDNPDKRRK